MREPEFERLSLTGNGTYLFNSHIPKRFKRLTYGISCNKANLRGFSLHSSRKSFENLQFKIFKVSLYAETFLMGREKFQK